MLVIIPEIPNVTVKQIPNPASKPPSQYAITDATITIIDAITTTMKVLSTTQFVSMWNKKSALKREALPRNNIFMMSLYILHVIFG